MVQYSCAESTSLFCEITVLRKERDRLRRREIHDRRARRGWSLGEGARRAVLGKIFPARFRQHQAKRLRA